MKYRTVLTHPNPSLRIISEPMSLQDTNALSTKILITDLKKIMQLENGVGIAAPQIGVHKRLILVDTGSGIKTFINPEIISHSYLTMESEEGCLSIPEVYGVVKRYRRVNVRAFDINLQPFEISAKGFTSTIFQHEIDHLNGILFIDKVLRFTPRSKL